MYDDLRRFSILQIMYEYYYHEHLAKISLSVKYLIDAYDRYILPRYVLPCSGTLIPAIIMVIPSMLCFPGFLTVSYRFPRCFQMFLPVFLRFTSVFLLFPHGVSPVSYFRFCDHMTHLLTFTLICWCNFSFLS